MNDTYTLVITIINIPSTLCNPYNLGIEPRFMKIDLKVVNLKGELYRDLLYKSALTDA